jgi:hypothetical protein
MIDAERPEALWLALRMVQAVLRESPSALACSSSVRNPADLTASTSSLILEDCRAFILAVGRSGRCVRACTRAAEDGRNTSDECESMHRFPLIGRRDSCNRMFAAVSTNASANASLLTYHDVWIAPLTRRRGRRHRRRRHSTACRERPRLGFRASIDPPTRQPNAPR